MIKTVKLAIKCILVTAPLWLFPIYCSTHLLEMAGEDYVAPLWNKNFTNTKQTKYYSTLIIGDSTANAAYIPEVLSDSTVNLALAGSSTIEGYYTLEDYLKYNKAPNDVFVSYMDYHLEEDDFTWDVCNWIHKFTKDQNKEIYEMIQKYGDKSVEELTADDYYRETFMYSIYSPTVYSYSAFKSLGSMRDETNKNMYADATVRFGRYNSITNEEYDPEDITGYSDFIVGALQEKYYYKILDLCKDKNINVHLIKLPLSIDSGFVDDYEEEIQDYYDNLLEDYDNADFYWFHTTYEHEFFANHYHMNNHGAFRFSRELKEVYPEVFEEDDVDSPERMLAFDTDIVGENYMGEISKWIDDKPYTLIFIDSTGQLNDLYYPYVGYNGHDVTWLDLGNANSKYALWYLSGTDEAMPPNVQIAEGDNGITMVYGGQSAELAACTEYGMSFAVLDNVNETIVCTRQCLFTERGLREVQ